MVEQTAQISIGVPKETYRGERRVALVPDVAGHLSKEGLTILVESGAGEMSGFEDSAYADRGVAILLNRRDLFQKADFVLQVRSVGANPEKGRADLELFRPGQVVIGHFEPLSEPAQAEAVARTGVTAYAIELIPRIARAQSMDALSSMASVSGYKAVILAAEQSSKMFPLMMTAAGTITPAHVFVIGAGVAGLQAIATAHRLGAVVRAYDVRPAVKEQVESLGAKFVELEIAGDEAEGRGGYAKAMGEDFYKRQQELMSNVIAESDVVITTAAVPGKRSPILITSAMVDRMRPGSIIVDLAAERGGNCELTKPGVTVEENAVRILGPINLPSTAPYHASQMYARNLEALIRHILANGGLTPDRDDEIINATMLTYGGEIVNQQVRELSSRKANETR